MRRRTQNAAWVAIALGAIAMTILASRRVATTARPMLPARDYSNRSGFPLGIEASRGAAKDAMIPSDYRTPPALRPYTNEAAQAAR